MDWKSALVEVPVCGAGRNRPAAIDPLRLLIGCAAGLPEKSWAASEMGACRQDAVDVLIVGSAADQQRAAEVIAASGGQASIRSVAGQTPLRMAFAQAECVCHAAMSSLAR